MSLIFDITKLENNRKQKSNVRNVMPFETKLILRIMVLGFGERPSFQNLLIRLIS